MQSVELVSQLYTSVYHEIIQKHLGTMTKINIIDKMRFEKLNYFKLSI